MCYVVDLMRNALPKRARPATNDDPKKCRPTLHTSSHPQPKKRNSMIHKRTRSLARSVLLYSRGLKVRGLRFNFNLLGE